MGFRSTGGQNFRFPIDVAGRRYKCCRCHAACDCTLRTSMDMTRDHAPADIRRTCTTCRRPVLFVFYWNRRMVGTYGPRDSRVDTAPARLCLNIYQHQHTHLLREILTGVRFKVTKPQSDFTCRFMTRYRTHHERCKADVMEMKP